MNGKLKGEEVYLVPLSMNHKQAFNEMLIEFEEAKELIYSRALRPKGYAKTMLKMGLEVCENMGMKRILVTCNKENVASAKTIIANGGVFENELMEDNGTAIQRYWIEL